jgi:apolipoprotein N-acyltransferase
LVWIAAYGLGAVGMATAVLLFRTLVRRGRVWSALVAMPAMWVTCEYVRNLATPHGSAGSLAYTQLRFLPFLQLASVTGPWGMTFFLLLFQSAICDWDLSVDDGSEVGDTCRKCGYRGGSGGAGVWSSEVGRAAGEDGSRRAGLVR